jgi:hypothetical protein
MKSRSLGSVSLVQALLALAMPAVAQQGPNFDRVTTLRREVTIGPARAGRASGSATGLSARRSPSADPLRPYTSRTPDAGQSFSSLGQKPRRAPEPMSVQVRTTPHTFYPGMRASQGPNLNVPVPRSRTAGRGFFPFPGLMMNPSASPIGAGVSPASPGAGRKGTAKPSVKSSR